MTDKTQTEAIRDLNDKFRRELQGGTLLLEPFPLDPGHLL